MKPQGGGDTMGGGRGGRGGGVRLCWPKYPKEPPAIPHPFQELASRGLGFRVYHRGGAPNFPEAPKNNKFLLGDFGGGAFGEVMCCGCLETCGTSASEQFFRPRRRTADSTRGSGSTTART